MTGMAMAQGAAALSWTSALLAGLSVGMTTCALGCLPYLGAWAFGRAGGASEGARHAAAFMAGRWISYALLGAAAGAAGEALRAALSGRGAWILGAASIVAGLALLWPRGSAACKGLRKPGLPPLLLGLSMALTPCAPLASLLAACAASGSAAAGASLGAAFGLGAALTPAVLFAPALGGLGARIVQERAWMSAGLRFGGAAVLVWLGLARLWAAA